jgi:transcriptional regulator
MKHLVKGGVAMYIPKHFEVTDAKEIARFIEANSFGQLISIHEGNIVSSHIPFILEANSNTLLAHLAKANPQWQQIQGQDVLVTLQGDHAYVSPSWYESAGVPTWNYQAVHIEGIAQSFTEPEKLGRVVDSLTHQNESRYPQPWLPKYDTSMIRGIVGVEITITSIQCKYKLSQNRSRADQTNVKKMLAESGHTALAEAMSS